MVYAPRAIAHAREAHQSATICSDLEFLVAGCRLSAPPEDPAIIIVGHNRQADRMTGAPVREAAACGSSLGIGGVSI